MTRYNATVEVAAKAKGFGKHDQVMAELEPFHGAIHAGERGWMAATITLPAESLVQATAAAVAIIQQAYKAEAIACEVMTEAEFDLRAGFVPVPELVSVSEAAELLGVSRQRVLQRITERTLPATRVGRDYVIPRSAVERDT